MTDRVLAFADQLRQHAEHFAQHDWNYTRNTNIRHIRYAGDWSGYDAPWLRINRAFRAIVRKDGLARQLKVRRWVMALVYLRTDKNLPDGVLDGGNIITHWEETGEYLQYVQPSVGSLLADWMEADPDSPHAQRIADEMKRINDAYGERIRAADMIEEES